MISAPCHTPRYGEQETTVREGTLDAGGADFDPGGRGLQALSSKVEHGALTVVIRDSPRACVNRGAPLRVLLLVSALRHSLGRTQPQW